MDNQSSFIVALLLGAFILFLAARGRLGTYADALWSSSEAPSAQGGGGSGGGGLGSVAAAGAKAVATSVLGIPFPF